MRKNTVWMLLVMILLGTNGCAQTSESEKLKDQLKKTGDELERNSQSAADSIAYEAKKASEKMKKDLEAIQ